VSSGAISAATVGRLPAYLRSVVELAAGDISTVSSDHLADRVGVNSATVRRDLASLGITGTRGVGYDVKYLVFEISVELGLNQDWPVAVVGAGNLGRALANYAGLADRGFPVRVLLDTDPTKVGTVVSGIEVRHLDEMQALVRERAIAVGVIATPAEAAQVVADALVSAGVMSILNFTANPVVVPGQVVVRRVDLATELQILSFYQQRGLASSTGVGVPLEMSSPETSSLEIS
jgi:redox-sensing transcriptional repressor